jgi:hypothetical protein
MAESAMRGGGWSLIALSSLWAEVGQLFSAIMCYLDNQLTRALHYLTSTKPVQICTRDPKITAPRSLD